MEQVKLRVKLQDVIKSDRFLPLSILAGFGIALYNGSDIKGILIYALPVCIAIWTIVLLIELNTSYLLINTKGLTFTASDLKSFTIKWSSAIEIEDQKKGKYQCKKITDIKTKKYVFVPSVIFSYPEISDFVLSHSPKEHDLLKCL
jgi:hypothetical protein